MASAAFELDPGTAVFGSTPQVVSAAGATVRCRLLSVAGVQPGKISWSIEGTNNSGVAEPAITLSGSPLGQIATFTIAAGNNQAFLVQCEVNDGPDVNGEATTRAKGKFYVLNDVARQPIAYGETSEGDTSHGVAGLIDAMNNSGAAAVPGGTTADFLIHTGAAWDNLKTATQTAVAAAYTVGLGLTNSTASTDGARTQASPGLRLTGSWWDLSGTPAARTAYVHMSMRQVIADNPGIDIYCDDGKSHTLSLLHIGYSQDAGLPVVTFGGAGGGAGAGAATHGTLRFPQGATAYSKNGAGTDDCRIFSTTYSSSKDILLLGMATTYPFHISRLQASEEVSIRRPGSTTVDSFLATLTYSEVRAPGSGTGEVVATFGNTKTLVITNNADQQLELTRAATTTTMTVGAGASATASIVLGRLTIQDEHAGAATQITTLKGDSSTDYFRVTPNGTDISIEWERSSGNLSLKAAPINSGVTPAGSLHLHSGVNAGAGGNGVIHFDIGNTSALELGESGTSLILAPDADNYDTLIVIPGRTSNGAGGSLWFQGGAAVSGDLDGGNVEMNGGDPTGTGAPGKVVLSTHDDGNVIVVDGTAAAKKIGIFGVTPVVRASAYTPTNVVTDRSYDANATTVEELADVLGTLIADLQLYGWLQ